MRFGWWTLEERRNRCDLIEVFKMFYGYTGIDMRVLFTLDGNDKGLYSIVKKIVNQNLIRILGTKSLTDGTVLTRTLLMHPA